MTIVIDMDNAKFEDLAKRNGWTYQVHVNGWTAEHTDDYFDTAKEVCETYDLK